MGDGAKKGQVSAGHEEVMLVSTLSAMESLYRVLSRRGNRKQIEKRRTEKPMKTPLHWSKQEIVTQEKNSSGS